MKTIYLTFGKAGLLDVSPRDSFTKTGSETTIKADYLGKGMFCNAFKGTDNKVYLLIKQYKDDFDYSKEAIAQWADSDNKHIPEIESYGQFTISGNEYLVFRMPFYFPLTSKHKEAWKVFKALKKAFNAHSFAYNPVPFHARANNEGYEVIERAEIGQEYKDALQSILNSGSNYGIEYGLEFSKVNLSVNENGDLIFRDVLFNALLCYKIRDNKRKVSRY